MAKAVFIKAHFGKYILLSIHALITIRLDYFSALALIYAGSRHLFASARGRNLLSPKNLGLI